MVDKKKTTMREEFDIVAKLAEELSNHTNELNRKITTKWGFNYSDVDFERAIDTLDYGTSGLSFDEFVTWMNTEGKKRHKGTQGADY